MVEGYHKSMQNKDLRIIDWFFEETASSSPIRQNQKQKRIIPEKNEQIQ